MVIKLVLKLIKSVLLGIETLVDDNNEVLPQETEGVADAWLPPSERVDRQKDSPVHGADLFDLLLDVHLRVALLSFLEGLAQRFLDH